MRWPSIFHQALTPRMREARIDCALDGIAGDVLVRRPRPEAQGWWRSALAARPQHLRAWA
jgi:hypothetical protein